MPLLASTPLVVDGRPRFGMFDDSLRVVNHAEFKLETPFGKPAGPLKNWLGFKRFQYFGGMSDALIFGCALAHLRHIGVAFVYVHELATGRLFSRSYRIPFGVGMDLASNPVRGESRFRVPGVDIRLGYEDEPRCKRLYVRLGDTLSIDAAMLEAGFEPMSICTRTAYTGWVYANKTAGLALTGALTLEGKTHDLAALGAMGHHDFSCGFMRHETYWNWACFSGIGRTASGVDKRLGLNVSCGVNETSFNENCLWVDGKLVKVNLAQFDFDTHDVMKPWRVSTDDGLVDLHFTPVGMHREVLDLKVVASNFRQVFGRFDGIVRADGEAITVKNVVGFVEDQYAKW